MDDGCALLFGLILILAVVGLVVLAIIYVIVPATAITIGSLAVAGVSSGLFVATKNVGKVLIEAHQQDFEAH